MKNEALSAIPQEAETIEENPLRPLQLSDFIGQQALRENLKVYIEAAKSRGAQLRSQQKQLRARVLHG